MNKMEAKPSFLNFVLRTQHWHVGVTSQIYKHFFSPMNYFETEKLVKYARLNVIFSLKCNGVLVEGTLVLYQ